MKARKIICLLLFLLTAINLTGEEQETMLLLRIGDKNLKDKTMDIFPRQIYSVQEDSSLSFEEMAREMMKNQFIYLGETHNILAMHEIQLKVIQALYQRDRSLIIGLEMLPVSSQEVLNKWSIGILTKEEFLRESIWYEHWNINFSFYEKIFQFAKENRIPLYALNASRNLIHKIRMQGWNALSDEEKEIIPRPDLSNQEHRSLIRTIFENTSIPHEMKGKGLEMAFEGLYRAQAAWDEVMAYNADRLAEREKKRMIVLAGSGHFLYNLGINRRAFERDHLPFKTLICVEIPEEQKSLLVSRSLADFIWGIAEEERPAYPSIGLELKKIEGLDNLFLGSVPIEGVAKSSDFQKGDVILSVDGKTYSDINELRMYLARFHWGDEVRFRILRQGEEKEITMELFYKEEKEGQSGREEKNLKNKKH
jgi:aminopeptidase N